MTTATKRSHATLAVSLAVTVLTLGAAAAPLAAVAQPAPTAGTGAPLPPSKPIHDLKSIAGKWEGRYTSRTGVSEAFGWTINEDGSYEVRPFEQKGLLQISEGKLRFRNLATGRTGIATLHEGGGRRVLRGVSDDGDFSWELTPAATAPLPAERKPAIRVGILTSNPVREAYQRALEEFGLSNYAMRSGSRSCRRSFSAPIRSSSSRPVRVALTA